MITFLNAPEDVIALTVSHKITGVDLDSIMDRLEPMMESGSKVHVFVETKQIDGIELSGLRGYMARALPLFGKLGRFGRVAVVSDQAWIRWGTRIESALLPFIAYRVFEPAESDAALAWVKGD
jgi:hypothetical protein